MNDANGHISVISGGFPCQPISIAGQKKGCQDERWMWGDYLRIIQETQPDWVVIENSPRLLLINEWGGVQDSLEREGFELLALRVSAQSVGAPHIRERAFVIAHAKDESRLETDKAFISIRKEGVSRDESMCCSQSDPKLPDWKKNPPAICRMDDGISHKLDKPRLQALGNAIVPRVIYPIFRAIKFIETGE